MQTQTFTLRLVKHSAGAAFPETMWSLHHWTYSKPNQTQPWETCCSWHVFQQEDWTRPYLRVPSHLSPSATLWKDGFVIKLKVTTGNTQLCYFSCVPKLSWVKLCQRAGLETSETVYSAQWIIIIIMTKDNKLEQCISLNLVYFNNLKSLINCWIFTAWKCYNLN